ncbi:hypothetical protein [uncultured Thermanaerothrix sp.]|uniref:hypothetical protein n=1 Tax=uncultured Thermanaerothrix sp. TaxID=1195149 RepID=UPI002614ABF9|nr:hypothetical protein [uncultured Thermanaerothrix sp.]
MSEFSSYPSTRPPLEKPGTVTALGVLTLVSGIINILTGLGLTGGLVLGTFGIGLLCAPITVLPAVLGVFEILYATKILANPPVPVQFSQTIAILEICCILFGNVIALVVGILALVFYSDAQVRGYFETLNTPAA